mgnify:CR=1 FL=1
MPSATSELCAKQAVVDKKEVAVSSSSLEVEYEQEIDVDEYMWMSKEEPSPSLSEPTELAGKVRNGNALSKEEKVQLRKTIRDVQEQDKATKNSAKKQEVMSSVNKLPKISTAVVANAKKKSKHHSNREKLGPEQSE